MGLEAWITVAVVAVCFGAMATNRVSPDIAMVGGVTLLLVTNVITPQQAFAGLANEGVITVAVLYVVVSGLKETGAIAWFVQSVLGRPRTIWGAQLRLMSPVGAISAFLNNTPVVAMFIPAVSDWAKKNQLPVSKLMMPLSYAAIVGGLCTLIGTSTNLVVNGLIIRETGQAGLSMFELAWVGIPLTAMTFVYLIVVSKWLLPDTSTSKSQFGDARRYTVEMLVEPNSPLEGKTIEQAGLRHLPGLFLVAIERDEERLHAVAPQQKLSGNDRLIFAGIVDSVVDLQRIRGLKPATDQVFKLGSAREDRCLLEAVVSNSCPLAGKSIREGKFRTVYNAAVIAVGRDGEQIKGKLGDIVLQPGDTLLLEAHPSFAEQQRNSRDFYLVSTIDDSTPPAHSKAVTALVILLGMVVSVSFGWLSMIKGALLAAGLMIITRCTRGREARRTVEWQVIVVIAASFGVGAALQNSGAAEAIAHSMIAFSGGSPWAVLTAVFIVTAVFTSLATNNAAAVIMFPIAMAAAAKLGVSYMPYAITIMVAASASFATPIGYQTNLMVCGPGGYRFSDYVHVGTPLTGLVGVVTLLIVPQVWPFT